MANDPISLCNRALGAVGTRSSITSFVENSNEARAATNWYDACRKALLRMAPWNCAQNYNILTVFKAAPGTPENPGLNAPTTWNKTIPPPPWAYEYTYPSDCLRPLWIIPQFATGFASGGVPITTAVTGGTPSYWNGPPVRFKVSIDQDQFGNDLRVILTNQSQAILAYLKDVQDSQIWDDQFVEAFVAVLSARFIFQLVGDKALANMKIQDANNLVQLARVGDGNEGLSINDVTPDFIRVRGIQYPVWEMSPNVQYDWGPLFTPY